MVCTEREKISLVSGIVNPVLSRESNLGGTRAKAKPKRKEERRSTATIDHLPILSRQGKGEAQICGTV